MGILQIIFLIIIIILAIILILIIVAGIGFVCFCKSTDGLSYPYKYLTKDDSISNSQRHRILYDMFDVLMAYTKDITIWPVYGTLLGIIREQKIICYDYDLDFGIYMHDWTKLKEILDKIVAENPEYGYMWYDFSVMQFAQLYHKKTMVNCDISVYTIKNDKVKRVLIIKDKKYNPENMFPLRSSKFKHYYKDIEYDIKIPVYPDKILKQLYGENYMTPDHQCDANCENCVKVD